MKLVITLLVLSISCSAQSVHQFNIVQVEHNGVSIKNGERADMSIICDTVMYVMFDSVPTLSTKLVKLKSGIPTIYSVHRNNTVIGTLILYDFGFTLEIFRFGDQWIYFNDRYAITRKTYFRIAER